MTAATSAQPQAIQKQATETQATENSGNKQAVAEAEPSRGTEIDADQRDLGTRGLNGLTGLDGPNHKPAATGSPGAAADQAAAQGNAGKVDVQR